MNSRFLLFIRTQHFFMPSAIQNEKEQMIQIYSKKNRARIHFPKKSLCFSIRNWNLFGEQSLFVSCAALFCIWVSNGDDKERVRQMIY